MDRSTVDVMSDVVAASGLVTFGEGRAARRVLDSASLHVRAGEGLRPSEQLFERPLMGLMTPKGARTASELEWRASLQRRFMTTAGRLGVGCRAASGPPLNGGGTDAAKAI